MCGGRYESPSPFKVSNAPEVTPVLNARLSIWCVEFMDIEWKAVYPNQIWPRAKQCNRALEWYSIREHGARAKKLTRRVLGVSRIQVSSRKWLRIMDNGCCSCVKIVRVMATWDDSDDSLNERQRANPNLQSYTSTTRANPKLVNKTWAWGPIDPTDLEAREKLPSKGKRPYVEINPLHPQSTDKAAILLAHPYRLW